jgi:hypothetical protein
VNQFRTKILGKIWINVFSQLQVSETHVSE